MLPKNSFQSILLLGLLHAIYAIAPSNTTNITINATNPSIAPLLNAFINMSGEGTYNIYTMSSTGQANQDTVGTVHSKWMQDDVNKTLYITVGDDSLGDPVCIYKFYFVNGKHYTVSYNGSNCSLPICGCTSGFGYYEEVSCYNSTFLGYVGRSYDYRLNEEIDTYAGRTLDGVGPLTVLTQIRVSDGAFIGLTTLPPAQITGVNASTPYYSQYMYNDVNMTRPDAQYGVIPQICLTAEATNNCSAFGFDLNGNPIAATTNSTNSKNGVKLIYMLEVFLAVILMTFLF